MIKYTESNDDIETLKEDAQELIRRFQVLESKRRYYESTWDDITEYVMPSRGTYVYKDQTKQNLERKSLKRLDTTAVIAHRTLTSKIIAEMTSSGTRWFELRVTANPVADKNPVVRDFLQKLSDAIFNLLYSSSFVPAHLESTADWAGYGTNCIMVDRRDDSISFKSIPLKNIYIEEDHNGQVNTVYNKFTYTYAQAVEFFGEDKLPMEVYQEYENDPYCNIEFIHCVEPNENYNPAKLKNIFFQFKSTYFTTKGNKIVDQGYFRRNPYKVARFWKRTGEPYGGAPAVDSLADIRMLNALKKVYLECTQKKAAPAWLLPHDSVMAPLQVVPNGVNYGGVSPDGRPLIHPMPSGEIDLSALQVLMQDTQMAIRSSFFVDPLINRENSIRTAAEVVKRSSEETSGIAPFLTRYQLEYLEPIIDDVLDFILQTDKTLQVPVELNGLLPKVNFTSPLAKTQRGQELNNMLQFSQVFQSTAQADPSMMLYLDKVAYIYNLADLFGVPFDVLHTEEEVNAMQQQQAQQQQAQQLMQGVGGAADALANLGKSGLVTRQDFGAPPVPQSL